MTSKNTKRLKNLNLTLIFIFCLLFILGESVHAQSNQYKKNTKPATTETVPGVGVDPKGKTDAKPTDSEKLDISGLEQKYWAPKDTDFSVVQNRTYTKEKKIVTSLMYGVPINDPYNKGSAASLKVNYFFNERSGVQLAYQTYSLEDSDLINSFLGIANNTTALKPDYGRIKNQVQIGYSWVPIYAKVSFLNKKIIYLDMAITPHVGTTTYGQAYRVGSSPNYSTEFREKSTTSYGIDITQYYFFTQHWALRADLSNTFYNEEVVQYIDINTVKKNKTTNSSLFTIGASFYFSL